jgi:hypothetical protein
MSGLRLDWVLLKRVMLTVGVVALCGSVLAWAQRVDKAADVSYENRTAIEVLTTGQNKTNEKLDRVLCILQLSPGESALQCETPDAY